MIERYRTQLLLCALLALVAPSGLDAQFRRGRARQADAEPWTPISIGVHGGYDNSSNGELIGAHAHLPILRSGRVAILPSAEITFLNGAKDYQYSAELLYVTGGRAGGLYVGGGAGYRDSVIDATAGDPRNTFLTYSIVAGLKSGVGGPLQTQLQLRWIFLQDVIADFRPIPLTLGIGFPLWGGGPSGS